MGNWSIGVLGYSPNSTYTTYFTHSTSQLSYWVIELLGYWANKLFIACFTITE